MLTWLGLLGDDTGMDNDPGEVLTPGLIMLLCYARTQLSGDASIRKRRKICGFWALWRESSAGSDGRNNFGVGPV
jgi:hypothetical protein